MILRTARRVHERRWAVICIYKATGMYVPYDVRESTPPPSLFTVHGSSLASWMSDYPCSGDI